MTSVFGPDGKQTACTIIEAGPNVVTQVKTKETDGYNAIQVGFGDKTEKHTIAAEKNHFAKANTPAKKITREFRDYSIEKNVGEVLTVELFTEGEKVNYVNPALFRCTASDRDTAHVGQVERDRHPGDTAPVRLGTQKGTGPA